MATNTRMRPLLPSIVFALIALATGVHAAGLVFAAERVVVDAAPDQDVVEANFTFKNHGTKGAKIVSVQSGCQCLDARAPEGETAAGATGVVVGVFKVGAFQGLVEKQMLARVQDDDGTREVVLTVAVKVPEVIRVEPGTLTWSVGQAPVEQSLLVTAIWPEKIKIKQLECSQKSFGFRIETIEDGKQYRIHVKPNDTKEQTLALFQILTDSRFEKFRKPMAFLSISKKP